MYDGPVNGRPGRSSAADLPLSERPGTPEDQVLAYHERTKHDLGRFAASLGYLDWATQPDPFRRFGGAPTASLRLPPPDDPLPYAALFAPDARRPAPLTTGTLSRFLRLSLSITAWKEYRGSRWSLRANPSSGNLHPTEGYLVLPPVDGLGARAAVWHYRPRDHALERRTELDAGVFRTLLAGAPAGSFVAGLTSVFWREAWKYGERAYRYSQHDVGHAIGTLRFAGAALGWRARLLDEVDDATVASLLGLERDADFEGAERESPEALLLVGPEVSGGIDASPVRGIAAGEWSGRANVLSPSHAVDWDVIDVVAEAAVKRTAEDVAVRREDFTGFPNDVELRQTGEFAAEPTAEHVILGRRSAVAMDRVTSLPAERFFDMLARVVPTHRNKTVPWDALPWRPRIHLGLFVHRVDGLAPGLYSLGRDPAKVDLLRASMRAEFAWERPERAPPGLPLFRLASADVRTVAEEVSCGQAVAADGAFSLGMIAELHDSIERYGPWFYRRLFWEAGLVGQVLYLEAEAAGLRATGIGCFFDDPMHDVFGLRGGPLESLYHFTVGGPVEDSRLTTLPAYA